MKSIEQKLSAALDAEQAANERACRAVDVLREVEECISEGSEIIAGGGLHQRILGVIAWGRHDS